MFFLYLKMLTDEFNGNNEGSGTMEILELSEVLSVHLGTNSNILKNVYFTDML
jgi:hypothetical protein